ncbi:hypothetical protein W97_04557 [Coniosporium apollinis CBS 100218]|uniref:Uncharacterized protein n=1 Tax=Coniosporium apollinis (strain CBS 100218) TaxID=1168221 RepID=R7YU27_CONA1|nr:uncharacterized protein W97_04557 [Coniosporium apollinis CBS 100218]EON65319.1 hypothetical protein W97_04557 [Coniosporium apollinis CBS 100218]
MPRSAADATRFTATGPYAYGKPTSRASTIALNSAPAPLNETPQQKVLRLRDAARKARGGQTSTFDRVVTVGRSVADRVHRFTAMTLIGFTGVASVVALFSLGDMIIYNRRKRKEWFNDMREKEARELAAAQEAAALGAADEDQILLINRVRAAQEADAAKKSRPGLFKRITGVFYGGLSQEEQQGGKLNTSIVEQARDAVSNAGEEVKEEGLGIMRAVEDKRREGEKAIEAHAPQVRVNGGPLDQLGAEASVKSEEAKKSWTSWMTRR